MDPFSRWTNPFDRIRPLNFEATVLLGPTFLDSISADQAARLGSIGAFPFVRMLAAPTNDENRAKAQDAGLEIADLRRENKYFVLHHAHGWAGIGSDPWFDFFVHKASGVAPIALEHLFATSRTALYDIVVGTDDAIAANPKPVPAPRYIPAPQMIEVLRLLSVSLGHFDFTPRDRANAFFYYLYRRDLCFPEIRLPIHGGSEPHGLWERAGYLCRANDFAMIEASRTPGNSADNACLFYLAYQYMLATGMFDDLASLANGVFNLGKRRLGITLRRYEDGSSKALVTALRQASPPLFQFLHEPRMSAAIESFYPIRDALQHRAFPETMMRSRSKAGQDEDLPSVLIAPEGAVRQLAFSLDVAAPPAEQWVNKGEMIVDLRWLIDASFRATQSVVGGFLRLLYESPECRARRKKGPRPAVSVDATPASKLGISEPLLFRPW